MRIVSLVPSQTELLSYLGLDNEVVGITKFCVHPDNWFRNKTRVGGTKTVNIETVKALNPTLVIANKEENVQDQIVALQAVTTVYVSDIKTIDDALTMIVDIGKLTHTSSKAMDLVHKIKTNFSLLPIQKPLSTLYLIWRKPYMAAGGDTYINDVLQRIGWKNIFAGTYRYPETTIEEIKKINPQLILLSSEPYPFKQVHIDELKAILPHSKIILVDGEMFSWYGSRMLFASEYFKNLCEHL